ASPIQDADLQTVVFEPVHKRWWAVGEKAIIATIDGIHWQRYKVHPFDLLKGVAFSQDGQNGCVSESGTDWGANNVLVTQNAGEDWNEVQIDREVIFENAIVYTAQSTIWIATN